MVLSRDVERIRLSFPVRLLEGVKVKLPFLYFLLHISGTLQVRGLKFLPKTYLEAMQFLLSMLFFVPGNVCP